MSEKCDAKQGMCQHEKPFQYHCQACEDALYGPFNPKPALPAVEQRANETARSLKEKRVTVTTSGNGRIEKRGEIMKPDDKDTIIGQPDEVPCMDCGRPYPHGLDTVLTKKQWLMIHPDDGGVLCPSCIVNRAAKLPGVIGLYGCIILDEHLDPGASLESMIAAMRLENADYCRTIAESLHVQDQQAETIRQMTELLREYRNSESHKTYCHTLYYVEPTDRRCALCLKADLLLKEPA